MAAVPKGWAKRIEAQNAPKKAKKKAAKSKKKAE